MSGLQPYQYFTVSVNEQSYTTLLLELMFMFGHYRVKQAIVKKEEVVSQLRQQYQAACKRADHLEGLLDQQRKHLLKK